MNCTLIISRYNEDLSWLDSFNKYKIIIYNKGNEIDNSKYKNIFQLKNVGRESQTWLYHIVNHYNDLDDINVFLQGRIDDLGCMAYKDLSMYKRNIKKYGFIASRYGMLGPLHWGHNVGIEKDIRYKTNWEGGKISRSKIGFRKFAKNLFPEIPIFVKTSYGGCFSVTKETIRQNDISIYKYLLDILSKHENPIEGHYMERLWCYLFTKNNFLLQGFRDVLLTKYERFFNSLDLQRNN